MPFEWLFNATGGGEKAVLYVIVAVLSSLLYSTLLNQIQELKTTNKEMRQALHDLSVTIESWTPEKQQKKLRRPV